jgi:hypothetical protein
MQENGTMFVFGGYKKYGKLSNKLYKYVVNDNCWS